MSPSRGLQAIDVSLEYRNGARVVTALSSVAVHLEPGEFLAIVGPSGCGKTSLIRVLAGLLPPTAGKVLLGERPVDHPSRDVGVIFQQSTLFPWFTATGNVEFALRAGAVDKASRRARALDLLRSVGLGDFAGAWPTTLSGGMAQRLALARSIATEPKVLLLDEPFSALDAISRTEMHSVLLEIWHQRRMSLLLVTHDLDEAVTLADRVLIMSHRPGQIAREVPIALSRPRVRDGVRVAGFEEVHNKIAELATDLYSRQVLALSQDV